MEINNLELDKIVMGVRKVSDVVNILYNLYLGPELTPMMEKLIEEVREVMDLGIFTGEVKKNIIVKPYISFLLQEMASFKELKHSEFIELLHTTLNQEDPQFDYEIGTLETIFWPLLHEAEFLKYLSKYQRKVKGQAEICAH